MSGCSGFDLISGPGGVGAVLHEDDAVESLEASPELQVDCALDVHEDDAAREANRHHDKLGPKGPLHHT